MKKLDELGFEYKVEIDSNEDVMGFSSLFNYKDGTMTFITPDRTFADCSDDFESRDITLVFIGAKEKLYDCFRSAVRVDDPREVFFAVIENCFNKGNEDALTEISSDPALYRRNSYIASGAVIGENVRIGIGCVIEGDVVIGDDTEIHHNVVIRNKTTIGKRCTIHSGVIIGENGFGYTIDEKGRKKMLKHYGGVCIEDDVHIGDNSVIIRGAIDDTIISRGVKLNTLVHVAHNDVIGEDTIVTAPTHICGSVTIGRGCHIAGAAIHNQRTIGDHSVVGLGSVVVKDVPSETTVAGIPAKKIVK